MASPPGDFPGIFFFVGKYSVDGHIHANAVAVWRSKSTRERESGVLIPFRS